MVVQVGLGHAPAGVVVLAVEKKTPLTTQDVAGVIVSLAHGFEDVAFLDLESLLVEAWLAQHVEKELETFVESGGDASQACTSLGVAAEARDVGRKKRSLLVERIRGHALCPPGPHHPAGQARKTDFVGRLEIAPLPQEEAQADERKRVVLGDVDQDAVR